MVSVAAVRLIMVLVMEGPLSFPSFLSFPTAPVSPFKFPG